MLQSFAVDASMRPRPRGSRERSNQKRECVQGLAIELRCPQGRPAIRNMINRPNVGTPAPFSELIDQLTVSG
jgi:hypothetical protein